MKKQTVIKHNQEHMKRFGPEYQIFSDLIEAALEAAHEIPKEQLEIFFAEYGTEYEQLLGGGQVCFKVVIETNEDEW